MLAAIVLVAVKGLIDVKELRHVWRVSRFDFAVSMVAFAAVLLLGILRGVIVAVLVSLLLAGERGAAEPAPSRRGSRRRSSYGIRAARASADTASAATMSIEAQPWSAPR